MRRNQTSLFEALTTSRLFRLISRRAKRKIAVPSDDSPTLLIKGVDNLIAKARTNMVGKVIRAQADNYVRFEILQLPHNEENIDIIFTGWDRAGKDFSLDRYKRVYSDQMEIRADERPDGPRILEEIFARFNLDLPYDYQGRSLSVSDVVCFPDIGTAYYCDNFGWKEIPLKQ